MAGVAVSGVTVQTAETARPYFRWAACFDTPSIAPISDQERLARRDNDRISEIALESRALLREVSELPEHPGVNGDKLLSRHALGPTLQPRSLLSTRFRGHGVHHPFKNFALAGMQ